jgi:SH3 domain-containing protein
METGSGQGIVAKETRDEFVDIPTYVEPALGLTQRQKLFYHGSGIGVGLLIAALAFTGWRYMHPDTVASAPSATPQQIASTASSDASVAAGTDNDAAPAATDETSTPPHRTHHAKANAGADVIAAAKPATGLMYVHRANSDLRPAPSTSSEPIKKLAKGEKVQLLALSDKWAQVDDAGTKGWVRASVIKDTPPGEKKSRKKKSDDE